MKSLIIAALSIAGAACHAEPGSIDAAPEAGIYTPEEAIAAAEPVLRKTYGEEVLDEQRPLRATRLGSDWVVRGTLPRGYVGGTASVVVGEDGEIKTVSHGK